MPKIPLIGVSDSGRTPDINSHDAINLMPQVRRTGAKEQFYWISAPGLENFSDTTAVVRGKWVWDNVGYTVEGNTLQKYTATGGRTQVYSGVTTSTAVVTFANNATQLAFVQNEAAIYVYTASTGVTVKVTEYSDEYSLTSVATTSSTKYTATLSTSGNFTVGDDFIISGTTNFNNSYQVLTSNSSSLTVTFNDTSGSTSETSLLTASLFHRQTSDGTLPISPTHIVYMDSYGVCNNTATVVDENNDVQDLDFFVSDPSDFRVWQAANTGSAERDPDALRSIIAFQGDLWFFGENTTETYYNTGSGSQPFQPTRPSALQWGIVAPYSVAQTDQGIAFMGVKKYGHPTVLLTDGYNMVEVATHALDYELSKYTPTELASATAFAYHEEGSEFYVMSFGPGTTETSTQTWVFDASTAKLAGIPSWHKRQDYTGNKFRGKFYGYLGGKHIVSDHTESKLLNMDRGVYTDLVGTATKTIPRTGISGAVHADHKNTFHHSITVDMEHPVGSGTLTIDWSDDGGHTYETPSRTISFTGRDTRVQEDMLGSARNQRIYRLQTSATVPVNILTAYVDVTAGDW